MPEPVRQAKESFWISSLCRSCRIETACVTNHTREHGDERDDHQQSTEVGDTSGDEPETEFQSDCNREDYRTGKQHQNPKPLGCFAQKNVGLNERKQNCKHAKFNDVRMCGN